MKVKYTDALCYPKVSMESVAQQLSAGLEQIKNNAKNDDIAFALVIDGDSLNYALHDSLRGLLLHVGVHCATVICCRVSPKQKAFVITAVQNYFLVYLYIFKLVAYQNLACHMIMKFLAHPFNVHGYYVFDTKD